MSWQGGAPPYYQGGSDAQWYKDEFRDSRIRKAFIRKVYTIVFFQLLITFGAMTFTKFHEPTQDWLITNIWIMYVAMAVIFISSMVISCVESARRTVPWNYIVLGVFTAGESVLISVLGLFYHTDVIIMAVGITVLVVLVLTLFALQTKIDFTVCYGVLLVVSICFLIFGIVVMFFPSRTMLFVMASGGVIIFSVYLIFDTQLMMGGEHHLAISPEDYVFAALTIYTDIIGLFMYILMLLGMIDD